MVDDELRHWQIDWAAIDPNISEITTGLRIVVAHDMAPGWEIKGECFVDARPSVVGKMVQIDHVLRR